MQQLIGESSEWINREKLNEQPFRWQNGYGAFSYSRSHVSRVATYIQNQQEHHRQKYFLDEYRLMLEKQGVEYDERNIFLEPVG